MKRLSWRSILQRVEGRRIVRLWYGVEDGYLRIELDDGSVLLGDERAPGSSRLRARAMQWLGQDATLGHNATLQTIPRSRLRLSASSPLLSVTISYPLS